MVRGNWRRHIQLAIPLVLLALVGVAILLADVTEQLLVMAGLGIAILIWLLIPLMLRLQQAHRRRQILRQRLPDLAPAHRKKLAEVLRHLHRAQPRDLIHAARHLAELQAQLETDRQAAPPGPLAAVPDLPHLLTGLRGLITVNAIARPRETPKLLHPLFPEIERQLYLRGVTAMSKRALVDELTTAPLQEFDRQARQLFATLDLLVECTAVRHLLPATEAERYLANMVGRAPAQAHGDNWLAWWQQTRPRLVRAGGVALIAMRLLRDRRHNQVCLLGQRVWNDSVPGADLLVLLDLAAFYRFLTRRRHTIEDTLDSGRGSCAYFTEGRYVNIADTLRYPLIDAPHALQFCKTYPEHRERKIEFIDRLIDLMEAYPGEVDQVLAETLIRLIGDVPRQARGRGGWHPAVWREFWTGVRRTTGFEPGLEALVTGVLQIESGRTADARTSLESAARQMPDVTAPLINLVYLECASGHRDQARRAIQAVLAARPQQGTLALGLGRLALYALHDLALAERLFTLAQKLMFEPVEAHNHLGHICLITNRIKLAQDHFRRAHELDPGSPEALLNLARSMIELKMYWRAIDYLKTVVLQYPGVAADWANYYLFQTYKEIGQDRNALERLKSVPAPLLDDPDVLDEISYYLETQNEYPWAMDLQKRAMLHRTKKLPKQSSRAQSSGNPWDDPSNNNSDTDDGGLREGPAR